MPQLASASIDLPDTDATQGLARKLAGMAESGVCLLLDGPVGAGKTFLARAMIQHLMSAQGHVEDVPSPTFTLVQTYAIGALELWHADLYRLTSTDELLELGLETAFETAFCVIEWPDRMGDLAPPSALQITLTPDPISETRRTADISGPKRLIDALGQQPEKTLT